VSPEERAAQNMPTPAMVKTTPTGSSFWNVSQLIGSFGVVSLGTVKTARMLKTRYMMARRKKLARQLNMSLAIPEKIVPNTKPRGLPAEKHAKAAFFRFEGFS
jgi:hypothetical protein